MQAFITAPDVADLLALASGPAFLARRAELEREHGFPRPMPHSRRPLLWRRQEVAAWIEGQGRPAPVAARADNVLLLREARRA